MDKTVVWTSREYGSTEHCELHPTDDGREVRSAVNGESNGKQFRVDYLITLNEAWETQQCRVDFTFDKHQRLIHLQRPGGIWLMNDKPVPQSERCIDVDISITPFTNSLPVNRLELPLNGSAEISVVYIDVLSDEVKVVRQRYTRLSDLAYRFENVPNDFEAMITLDKNGLVVDYPGLFRRESVL